METPSTSAAALAEVRRLAHAGFQSTQQALGLELTAPSEAIRLYRSALAQLSRVSDALRPSSARPSPGLASSAEQQREIDELAARVADQVGQVEAQLLVLEAETAAFSSPALRAAISAGAPPPRPVGDIFDAAAWPSVPRSATAAAAVAAAAPSQPSARQIPSAPAMKSQMQGQEHSRTHTQTHSQIQPQTQPQPQAKSSAQPSSSSSNFLRGVDRKCVELILAELVDEKPAAKWTDVVGLEGVKSMLDEMVILPMIRPDLFRGIRAPSRGLLLFGPPGNGKTMIARALAAESGARFFNISASSLTSKYLGDGEKLVRALFAVAREVQPSVIFIDEVDSLLSNRSESEHEATRRLKTEFLVQFDGLGSSPDDRFLVIGATNRPQELDEAARRRFARRIYVTLPDETARCGIVKALLRDLRSSLSEADVRRVGSQTGGYSAYDLTELCRDAALAPLRENRARVRDLSADQLRPVRLDDFTAALTRVRASVSGSSVREFETWNQQYGSASL